MKSTVLGLSTAFGAIMVGASTVAAAEALDYLDISVERIQVIGEATDRAKIPGAATRLSEEDLEVFKYQDVLRTLRLIPGVNIQEEDGYGLRPNIGLRGSGVERSAKITLMEDGVLIAPAPYASPSAYYFPTAARMEAVEVRKGSAAIKFGPQSVGGALNMVSRSIPDKAGGFADVRVGSDNLLTLHGAAGFSSDRFGGVVELFHSENDGFKHLPGGGDTGFNITDYLGKFRVKTDEGAAVQQSLTLKLSRTDNDSNETYLGLSEADFEADPYQRYLASNLDRMETRHEQIQLTHQMKVGDVEVVTTAYRNEFERDWFKFNDVNGLSSVVLDDPLTYADELSWLRGEADSPIGAIRLRHNARSYEAKGVQTLVAVPFTAGGADHELEISLRYHEDREDRLQNDERYTVSGGTMVFASATAPGAAGNRVVSADAWAFFIQDTVTVGNWTIVPGLRYETIDLYRTDWAANDPARTGTATEREPGSVNALIPGLGVSYRMNDHLTLTGGLYKGFNPPAPGDAGAEEETSLNIEAGFILDRDGAYAEAMAFYSDYANILGTCTASIGCETADIGDQFNGGAARIYGLELVGGYDVALSSSLAMPIRVTYTYTDAEFKTSFEDGFWGDVAEGDHFPYLSRHQLTASVGLTADRYSLQAQANYVSASRTQAGQGTVPDSEKVDGRVVVDLSAHYSLTDRFELFGSIENLFDASYSVARRPIGLRPGKPFVATIGVKTRF